MSNSVIVKISSDKYTTKSGETLSIEVPYTLISRPVRSIRLIDAIIPFSFSTVPPDENQFDFTDTVGTNTITLPDGTFSPESIIETLKNMLDANSGAGLTFTVIYNRCEGRYEIRADGPYSLDFTVPNSAADLLGFNSVVKTAVETPPASNIWIVESDTRNRIALDKYINITSNLVRGIDQGIIYLDGSPNPTVSNVIASIPIVGTAGSNILFNESNETPEIDIRSSVLGQIQVPNTDGSRTVEFGLSLDSGNPVDLGGTFWSARFLIKYQD